MSYEKFWAYTRTQDGSQAVSGVAVTVFEAGTTTAATVYSDDDGSTPLSTITSDTDGYFEFYAAPGDYDIKFTKSGYTFRNLFDITIGQAASLPGSPEVQKSSRLIWDVIPSDATDTNISVMAGTWKANIIQIETSTATDETIQSILTTLESYAMKAILHYGYYSNFNANDTVAGFYTAYADISSALTAVTGDKPLIIVEAGDDTLLAPPSTPLCPTILYTDVFTDNYSPDFSGTFGGLFLEANPPHSNYLRESRLFAYKSMGWSNIGMLPGLDISGYSSGGSISYAYTPKADELLRSIDLLGSEAKYGFVIGHWSQTSGNKVGLSQVVASDTDITEIRRTVIAPMISSISVASTQNIHHGTEEELSSWYESILMNPRLFPQVGAPSGQPPLVWKTGSGPSWEITVLPGMTNLFNNGAAGEITQDVEIPSPIGDNYDGKNAYFYVKGYVDSVSDASISISLKNRTTGTVDTTPYVYLPSSAGYVFATIPFDSKNYDMIIPHIQVEAGKTAHILDMGISLGAPSLKYGKSNDTQTVKTNAVSVNNFGVPYGIPGVPLYVNAGNLDVSVPATSNVSVTIPFPYGPANYTNYTPGTPLSFRVVSVLTTLTPVDGGMPLGSGATSTVTSYAPGGESVTVNVANSSAFAIGARVNVVLFLMPIGYGAMQ